MSPMCSRTIIMMMMMLSNYYVIACLLILLAGKTTCLPKRTLHIQEHNHINHQRTKLDKTHIVEKDNKPLETARVEAIKQNILSRMGLEEAPHPNMNATIAEKRKMLKMYRRSVEEIKGQIHQIWENEEDVHTAPKLFNSFSAKGRVYGEGIRVRTHVDVPQPTKENRETVISSASLHLYRVRTYPERVEDERTVDLQVRIDVYQLLQSPAIHKKPLRKLIDSRLVSLVNKDSAWETFDIRQAVADWTADPSLNYGLELISPGSSLANLVKFSLRHRSGTPAPRISVYSQETTIVRRQKRATPETYDCKQGDGETRCCRYPMWISFKDIGWDSWVVQPEGYQAYFCDGGCPHSYKVAHNFAGIKSIISLANPAAMPAPTCTASELSPLALLHYNQQGQLIVTVYEDMIVEQCKCA